MQRLVNRSGSLGMTTRTLTSPALTGSKSVPRRKIRWPIAALFMLTLTGTGIAGAEPTAKVWKDPNCGCCKDWIAKLKTAGFDVEVENSNNEGVRKQLGVPTKLGSCHTAQIGKYVIEGHVPIADIKHLLSEAPDAKGLAVPGMPVGSPGMDGPAFGGRQGAYDVLLLKSDGTSEVYQSYHKLIPPAANAL